jgi:hypothetical protein
MRVIHLVRKPLSESSVATNTLRHGAGALNIDETRVGYQDESDMTPTVGKGEPGQLNPGCGPSFPHHKENWGTWKVNMSGRWPSNVVLQHLGGCHQIGVGRVKGIPGGVTGGPSTLGAMNDDGWKPRTLQRRDYADADGRETVEAGAWACVPGCPVADLDAQSGVLRARGNVTPKDHGANYAASSYQFGGRESGFAGDTGGASRFYKQVKP